MKTCKKCGSKFSVWLRIGDRVHNLNNRRYCIECSPFGAHNTTKLERDKKIPSGDGSHPPGVKRCTRCGIEKPSVDFYSHHSECRACFNQRSVELQRKRKIQAVEYKGGKCMRCGYQGHMAVFDFHHLERSSKKFEIGLFKNRSFKNLKDELDKCILLCANCHRELEALGDKADWSFIK